MQYPAQDAGPIPGQWQWRCATHNLGCGQNIIAEIHPMGYSAEDTSLQHGKTQPRCAEEGTTMGQILQVYSEEDEEETGPQLPTRQQWYPEESS